MWSTSPPVGRAAPQSASIPPARSPVGTAALAAVARAARRRARVLAACATLAASALPGAPARASCLNTFDADLRTLDAQTSSNAAKTIEAVKARIELAERSRHPDSHRLAELYAVEAQAYGRLELDPKARAAAETGLKLAPVPNDPRR